MAHGLRTPSAHDIQAAFRRSGFPHWDAEPTHIRRAYVDWSVLDCYGCRAGGQRLGYLSRFTERGPAPRHRFVVKSLTIQILALNSYHSDFPNRRTPLKNRIDKRSQGRTCGLRCISLDFGRSHGFRITSIKSLSLAERANPLAKHATGSKC